MGHRGRWARSLFPSVAALLALGAAALAQPTAPAAGKRQGAREGNWPRQIRMGESTILLDAPQAESLEGTKLTGQGTARLSGPEQAEPSFGTIWYEAEVEVNRDRRTVTLVSVQVPRVQFAGLPPGRLQRIATRLSQAATRMRLQLPLDDVLASARMARRREETPPKLNTEPPKILFETEPAVLVLFDGEPRFRAVEGTHLERAQNTPFLVLRDPGTNAYYLSGGTTSFRAPDPRGPWTKQDSVPSEATQVASRDLKEGGVAENEVQKAKQSADNRTPKILTATGDDQLRRL